MIFALREPPILLGLLLGFLAGIPLRVSAQAWLARGGPLRVAGAPRARLRGRARWAGRLDPFGAVAAVLSGVGWGPRPTVRRRGRGSDWQMLLAALLVHAALAAVGLAAYVGLGGSRADLSLISVGSILHGSQALSSSAREVAVGFGVENLACGLLALVPIPPLEMGVVLWSRLPTSAGARRLAYHLLEEQWGVAALLVLLLLPLAGELPALLLLIDKVGNAVLDAV